MSIKEMSDAIENHCDNMNPDGCTGCKLFEVVKDTDRCCYSYHEGNEASEAVIAENYKFLFGEPVPVNHVEKTCSNCKHLSTYEFDEPCVNCRNTALPSDRNYNSLQFLWEAEEPVPAEPVPAEHDSVNHPSHYCQEGSMECIDEMIAVFGKTNVMTFCLLNVWKYRKRAVFKNGEEDLKKSDWYMKKYIELKGDL